MNIFHFSKHLFKLLKVYERQKDFANEKKGYLKDKLNMLQNTAKEWDAPLPWLLCDCLLTMALHGESTEYYVASEMYKYNFMEKRRRLTVVRALILDYEYNITATEEEKQRIYNKKLFNICYKDFVKREWRYAPDETPESLKDFIKEQHSVFCKPHNLSQGAGAFILNDNEVTDEKIQKLIDQEYIVEEKIIQHPSLQAVHPQSVNSIRIFSIIDKNGTPHVTLPALRVGAGDSITDNGAAGGLFYIVDPDTGIITSCGRTERNRKKHIRHPGSNVIMPGFEIPYYQQVVEMIEKAAMVTPSLRYVGWDVAITPNGPDIIEANIEFAVTFQGADGLYREAKKYL